MVLLIRYLLVIKVSIIGTFWFLLEHVLNIQLSEKLKKNYGGPVFSEELEEILQAARNFSKVSLNFNKIPNS